MPEETIKPVVEPKTQAKEQDKTSVVSSAATENTEPKPQEQMIPKARFDEVNNALKKLQSDAAEQATKQEVEDKKKLAAQQEWQKLYEGSEAKVGELKPKADLADKLTEMVTAQYAAEIKEWPEQVRAMAPDDGADILTKLAWMSKAKPLAAELLKDKVPVPGNGSRPKVVGASGSKPAQITPITDVRRNF